MSKEIFVGFPSHFDYETLYVSSNKKDLKGFEYLEKVNTTNYTLVMWNDESIMVFEFVDKDDLIQEGGEMIISDENLNSDEIYAKILETCNDSEPDGDSGYGIVLLENGIVIAGNSENYVEY